MQYHSNKGNEFIRIASCSDGRERLIARGRILMSEITTNYAKNVSQLRQFRSPSSQIYWKTTKSVSAAWRKQNTAHSFSNWLTVMNKIYRTPSMHSCCPYKTPGPLLNQFSFWSRIQFIPFFFLSTFTLKNLRETIFF